eukprot:CAMPEP_0170363488 /NCGR_PEP_ID=MMETSP0117_2-20130122/4881_1 /TAXON_ID=400756 /ORGANISM="Durinskia baltica, Strain CSIRO CS-38" /LENGTH=258 /DNA_ID=CAMNT_0010617953 /DNA_START=113 /DNA_END=889 /DNA_ORIENTATION=+
MARLQDGADDEAARAALGAVEPPQPWTGGFLPPMRNIAHLSRRFLPSRADMPTYLPTVTMEERPPQGVRARLFLFYGAGDSVGAWLTFLQSDKLPEWLDVAIYESPGHGQRKEEEVRRCLAESAREAYDMVADVLKEHARGGSIEGAPFAFAGHSMGAQVAAEVAMLVKRQLGLEPICFFAIDRAPPHLKIYTEEGERLLGLDEPSEFFEGFNPTIHKMMSWPSRRGTTNCRWRSSCANMRERQSPHAGVCGVERLDV